MTLRPASLVMSPARAAAIVPNALSFPRLTMRELVRDRYRVEKLRFELDREGRGEILYRLVGGGWTFHFFLVSQKLAEEVKSDRNFAQSWDAMGVLCQGEWTIEREAHLRREVPKQRAGFADYDTLIYARGNRSARVFDHVVDRLAQGRQPDLSLVAPIGYILRTTAFIGNGQLGTRAWAGFESNHPFRRPYHAQFASAFMLREYVFDLVDHLARSRSAHAARLTPAYRRYIGLGNSAATGLAAFVANHPHLMHQWCLAHERALADAKATPMTSESREWFRALLDKAIRYHSEGSRDSDDVFPAPQGLARELAQAREALTSDNELSTWRSLCEWAEAHLSIDASEIVHAIVIEVHPALAERFADAFEADERFELDPAMNVRTLRERLEDSYGWALRFPPSAKAAHYFWYRSTSAPRDTRRGLRGRVEGLEAETTMDTVLQIQRLESCLDKADAGMRVADFVHARPALRHIVARVQSLHGSSYAELQHQMLAHDYTPFSTIRFALSFFGMEKFEAALPKSVRGTFMQGAPIAEDVADGRDGDWPFPLLPDPSAAARDDCLAPLPSASLKFVAVVGTAPRTDVVRIAPNELTRMVQTALQGHGAPLGIAEDAAPLVTFAQATGEQAVAAVLRHCAGDGRSPLVDAPSSFDVACAHALQEGLGISVVTDVDDSWLTRELVLRASRRGLVGIVLSSHGFAASGNNDRGPWYAAGNATALPAFIRVVAPYVKGPMAIPAPDAYEVICTRSMPRDVFAALMANDIGDVRWDAERLDRLRARWFREGIPIRPAELHALADAGRALLVPQDQESLVLLAGADPLKVF
ncbi:MAG TPA: hypothetical protein VNE58_15645 [Casimicrobiaceae bacterium]|nr:hypothetical protein [Casimicrobiaceae bacterium]